MKANTIKIEEDLLKKIYPLLAPKQSLASFVRSTLEKEVIRQKLKSSAEKYVDFLSSNLDEMKLLEDWASAELEKEPKLKKRKK